MASDNPGELCGSCQVRGRDLLVGPPKVPAEFWEIDRMRDALADWHMGLMIAAYRTHPYHGQTIRQELAASWLGMSQAQLSRIETGAPVKHLDRLIHWAQIFRVPPHLLWFKLPEHRNLPLYDPATALSLSCVDAA